ncbi:MAG: peptide ligase PGM1-related protein [Cyanobacteria bacterium J06638_7]
MPLSFRELQAQLHPSWGRATAGHGPEVDVLMVPSLSLDQHQMGLVTGIHHYEERQLFALIGLRHPGVRMVYASSKPLADLVVDAVLELLPGVPASHARRRLHLVDTDDASGRPLAAKLLERPALLQRIAELLRPGRSFISCFVVSDLERQLSERLQIPLLGTDPALAHWGSKAGSRALFARCGVPHPPGSALVHDLNALAEVTAELWEADPQLRRCVVKLNEGFSGEGNACLELEGLGLAELTAAARRRRILGALERLPMPAPDWLALLGGQGALVEAWLEGGEQIRSPSVQGMIHPGRQGGPGKVELLSSHEQVLGGVSGHTYLGCLFPAAEAYRPALLQHGRAVGEALAAEGALERYAVDFIARRRAGQWELQAIEVNLRQGGTTHPYMALNAITSGRMDGTDGVYRSPTGSPLFYRATDNLCDARLRGLLPIDLIDIVAEAGLHYDPAQLRGSVFHLLGCLSEFGKLGMTCIGRSAAEAEAVYAATADQLLRAAAQRAQLQRR